MTDRKNKGCVIHVRRQIRKLRAKATRFDAAKMVSPLITFKEREQQHDLSVGAGTMEDLRGVAA